MCKIHTHLPTMIATAQKSLMGQQHAAMLLRGNHPVAMCCNEIIGDVVEHAEHRILQYILRKDRGE